MTQLSDLHYVGLAKESVAGTAIAAPTLYIPCKSVPKFSEDVEYIRDESGDANASKVRGMYQGVRDGGAEWGGMLYAEVIGPYLVGLGLADTISGAGPYLHTFKTPASGVQPASYTLFEYNTVEERSHPYGKVDELTITIDSKGDVAYTIKWLAFPGTGQSSHSATYATTPPWLGWQNAVSIGGSASTRQLMTEITIKRSAETIHTQANTQNPREVFSGPIEAQIKGKAIFENNTDFAHLTSNDQPAFVCTLVNSGFSPAQTLTITATKAAFSKATTDLGGKYAALDYEAECVYNTTDAGPLALTLSNATSTAY